MLSSKNKLSLPERSLSGFHSHWMMLQRTCACCGSQSRNTSNCCIIMPHYPSISAYAQLNPRTVGIIIMDLEIVIITMVDLWSEVSQAAPASAIATTLLTLIGINECHFLNYMAFVQLCCVQSVQLNNSCSCKMFTLFRNIIVVPNIFHNSWGMESSKCF